MRTPLKCASAAMLDERNPNVLVLMQFGSASKTTRAPRTLFATPSTSYRTWGRWDCEESVMSVPGVAKTAPAPSPGNRHKLGLRTLGHSRALGYGCPMRATDPLTGR